MIATHNIKVNGRWILAGQEYEPEQVVTPNKAEKAAQPEVQVQEAPVEEAEKKAEVKPKTASRRKKISE